MPTFYDPSSCDNYLNVLGELEAFIGSNHCDINVIVGDFNVDFDRGGLFAKLLKDFMIDVFVIWVSLLLSSILMNVMIVSVVLGWIMSCVQNVSQIFFLIFMPFTLLQYTLTIFLCFSTLISLAQ